MQARSPALRRARARVQAWCDRGEVSILRETGDLMLKLIFSFMGIPAQDLPGWHRKYRQLLQLIVAPPVDLPGLPLRRGRAARDWIDAQLRQFVRDARAHAARTGLINDMVSAFDRSDDALSDDVLVANIRLLLLGGHDTTASTMAWIVIELARQPVLWDALVEEAQRVGAVPTQHADLAQCPVAEALFRETLRVHPPTTLVLRRALQELQLGQRRIPAGTHLCIPLLHFSTSALLHEAPDQFRLTRWLQRTGPIRPVDMLQFGNGPHVCIGYHLVWLELVQFCIALALTMHKAGVRPRLLSGVEKGRRYYPTAHPSMTVRIGFFMSWHHMPRVARQQRRRRAALLDSARARGKVSVRPPERAGRGGVRALPLPAKRLQPVCLVTCKATDRRLAGRAVDTQVRHLSLPLGEMRPECHPIREGMPCDRVLIDVVDAILRLALRACPIRRVTRRTGRGGAACHCCRAAAT